MNTETTDGDVLVLRDKLENTPPQLEAQIWAYLGTAGGVGVSALAVQTAYELSLNKDRRVCLVDLDFERGSCAHYLDMPASLHIEELNAGEGRMDAALAATFIREHSAHLSLIAAHSELGGNDAVSANAFLSLLDMVSTMYDFVILDIPSMWRPWTQAAIGAADKFALVTDVRIPSLHKTKVFADAIQAEMSCDTPPEIILNKFERRAVRGGLVLKDAQAVLARTDLGQICDDQETLRVAVNEGKPAGEIRPESRYVKSVHDHIQNWLGEQVQAEKPSSRLFKRRA